MVITALRWCVDPKSTGPSLPSLGINLTATERNGKLPLPQWSLLCHEPMLNIFARDRAEPRCGARATSKIATEIRGKCIFSYVGSW